MSLVSSILLFCSHKYNPTFLHVRPRRRVYEYEYAVRAPITERNRPTFVSKAKEPIALILDMSNGREGYGGRKGGNRRERGRRAFYCIAVCTTLSIACVCVCVCVCVVHRASPQRCSTLFIPKALREVVSSEQMCRTFFALAHIQLDHTHTHTQRACASDIRSSAQYDVHVWAHPHSKCKCTSPLIVVPQPWHTAPQRQPRRRKTDRPTRPP